MNELTLEQVQEKLDFNRQQIEQFFRTLNTPENILIKKDAFWGKRSVNIFIRLDEFSIEQLEKHLPELKALFNKYKQLREIEKEKSDKALIERRIQQDIMAGLSKETDF